MPGIVGFLSIIFLLRSPFRFLSFPFSIPVCSSGDHFSIFSPCFLCFFFTSAFWDFAFGLLPSDSIHLTRVGTKDTSPSCLQGTSIFDTFSSTSWNNISAPLAPSYKSALETQQMSPLVLLPPLFSIVTCHIIAIQHPLPTKLVADEVTLMLLMGNEHINELKLCPLCKQIRLSFVHSTGSGFLIRDVA